MLNELNMLGVYTLHLFAKGIYPLVFILLVQARSVFITISKECLSGLIYRSKPQWLYILTTVLSIIFAPSDEFASLSVSSYEEIIFRNKTGSTALDLDLDFYTLKNRDLGPVVEESFHSGAIKCSYVHSIKSNSLTNSAMEAWGFCKSIPRSCCCTISTRSVEFASSPVISCAERVIMTVTNGYALDVESDSYWLKNGTLGLFMEHSQHGGATCATDDIFPIANIFAIVNALAISFSESICNAFMLILEAPWFHFIILLWLQFRLFTTLPSSQNEVSRFRLLELKNTVLVPVIEYSVYWGTSVFSLLSPYIFELGSKAFWFTVKVIPTWGCLSYNICEAKYTLVSLLSFGMMFILTGYLVVLTLKLNRKRIRCRVNSCI